MNAKEARARMTSLVDDNDIFEQIADGVLRTDDFNRVW